MHSSNPAKARIGELDALRGLAAVAVMVFHFTGHYGKDVGHLDRPLFELAMGNYGVQLFFMISGFVIFMTLEKTRSAMDFAVTRFSRLYPAYWTALAVSALFVYTIGMPEQRLPLSDLAANVTMIQSLLHFRHLDGSYWTLQIELLFYAQMLCWFMFGQLHRVTWIIGGWLVVCVGYYFVQAAGLHVSWTLGQLLILEHIPFFGLGILFYGLHKGLQDGKTRDWMNHVMIAACIAAIAITHPPIYVSVVLFCTAVFYLFIYGQLKWLQSAPFAFLGAISYSMYLLHQAIGFDVIWHMEHDAHISSTLAIVVAIAVTVALATLITFFVERPTMRWIRERWKLRRMRATEQHA
jgi:peptidoglycan/LPS O-acetylase OafA/YrhL